MSNILASIIMRYKVIYLISSLLFLPMLQVLAQSEPQQIHRHALRLVPLRIMDADGMGFGVAYEGALDKSSKWSINIPITYIISNRHSNFTGLAHSDYIYVNPGIKYYFYRKGKISLAAGPSVFMGYGSGSTTFIEWNMQTLQEHDFEKIRMGILANGYFHVKLSTRVDLGFEIGLGVRLLDYHNNYQYGKTQFPNTSSGNFAIHFGYLL